MVNCRKRGQYKWLVLPVILAVMLWGGLYLRNAQLCTLTPLRR